MLLSEGANDMERQQMNQAVMQLTIRRVMARWVLSVAMLCALLVAVPGALAQRGAAGGHAGGFSGGHVGGFSGGGFHGGVSAPASSRGFASPAPRSFAMPAPRSLGGFGAGPVPRGFGMTSPAPRYNFAPQRGVSPGYRPPVNAVNRSGGDHREPHRPIYRGYGYGGFPYVNSWALLPWELGYPDFTGYGDNYDAQAQPAGEEQEQPPQEGYGPGYGPEYATAPYAPAIRQQAAPAVEPKLTLIFKDGHTSTIRNYMLTRSDLIVMDDAASGREPRIPLSDLNLPATEQAAQQDGSDFSPPST